VTSIAGRAVYALARQALMSRIMMAYAALTVMVAILAAVHDGFAAAVCAIFAPLLLCIAGAGARAMFFWGDRNRKLFGIVCVILIGALAVRLAPGFSIALFGRTFGGPDWAVIGGVLGLLASRRENWADFRATGAQAAMPRVCTAPMDQQTS
jgi:hypothetical protein